MAIDTETKRTRNVENPRKHIITTSVTPEVYNAIMDYAAEKRVTRSQAVFDILKQSLKV